MQHEAPLVLGMQSERSRNAGLACELKSECMEALPARARLLHNARWRQDLAQQQPPLPEPPWPDTVTLPSLLLRSAGAADFLASSSAVSALNASVTRSAVLALVSK